MRIYDVIPIARGNMRGALSYFGTDSIPVGSLVSIPLRGKKSLALVIEKRSVESAKADLKSSRFSLKKIHSLKNDSFLPQGFLSAVEETSLFFASSVGSLLSTLLPKLVLENSSKILIGGKKISTSSEKFVIQTENEERIAHYKGYIREEFAKKRSVFFCLPTIEEIRQVHSILERGIAEYCAVLHSDVSKKEWAAATKVLENKDHPVLIIGTVPFLSLIRPDVGTIIVDHENSRAYRTLARPFINLRKFAEVFAEKRKIRFIVGDFLLSVDTLWQQKNEKFVELSPVKFRMISSAESVLIDMKREVDNEEAPFRVLSPELEELIAFNKGKNQKLFIFAARKGLAPVTVCGDCGKVVTCRECGATLVLHSASLQSKENYFHCHKCDSKRSALEKCENCSSWKLTTLGVGIERVESEIKRRFPQVEVFRIDRDTVTTAKRARDIVLKFQNSPGSVLIGTEMALSFLDTPIENTAIASLDSLFAIPDFRINEKIFGILTKIRSLSQNIFVIQTRNAQSPLFEKALSGSTVEFYRDEIEDREKFSYPPFKIFVKLSLQGKKSAVLKEMEGVEAIFKEYDSTTFTGLSQGTEKKYSIHLLLRFSPEEWPNRDVVTRLLSLPPYIKIQVDPESLL